MRYSGTLLAAVAALAVAIAVGACGRDDAPQPPAPGVLPVVVAPAPETRAEPAPTYSVRVLLCEFGGAPVGGARIVATPPRPTEFRSWPGLEAPTAHDGWLSLPPSWDLTPRAEARTGHDGRCTLTGLAAGAWSIVTDTPGRVRRGTVVVVDAKTASPDVELRTETGHAFAGRALTQDGRPIAGATVLATYPALGLGRAPRAILEDFARARTDADGSYRFDALPEAVVTLRCGPPGAWSSHAWPVQVPSVAALDLRATTRGPVEGVVRSGKDATPVAGAEVVLSLENWHTAQVTARATTDAEGRYRIPLHPGPAVTSIAVRAAGFSGKPKVVGARQPPFRLNDDGPTVLDLALRPDTPECADVRVVVRGPDGPVAGASVWLDAPDESTYSSGARETDAQGRAHFLDVPAERLAVVVESAAGLYQPGRHALFTEDCPKPDASAPFWIAADAPRPADVEVVLERGGRVTGRVVDEAKNPVADARVFARNGQHAKSAADGSFTIEGLDEPREDTIRASCEARRLTGESGKFVAGAGRDADDITIVLTQLKDRYQRHVVVTGRVSAGDPEFALRDAVVESDWVWTPLDAAGAFRIETDVHTSTEELRLGVSVPEWGSREFRVALTAGATAIDAGEIEVPRAGSFTGRVTDAKGPLAGVVVALGAPPDGVIRCGPFEDAQPTVVAVTGADGSFAATGIPMGEYQAHVDPPEHAEEKADVAIPSGSAAQWSPTLAREAFLRGRVVRKDGRPVLGASLHAEEVNDARARWDRDSHYGHTDADGAFEIPVRDGLSYAIRVSPDREYEFDDMPELGRSRIPARDRLFRDLTTEALPAGGRPVSLVVDDGDSIAGRVVDADGRGVARGKVECKLSPRSSARPDDDEEDEYEQFECEAVRTDDDGAFELLALPDGTFDVTADVDLDERVSETAVAAGRSDLVLRLAPRTVIEGALEAEDGAPLSRRQLVATRMQRRGDDDRSRVVTETDEAGRFRFVGMGTAACRVELIGGSRWAPTRQALIGGCGVAPGTKDLRLRVPPRDASTVSGRIVGADGKGPAGSRVWVHVERDAFECMLTGEGNSEFRFDGLRLDIPCELHVHCSGLRWKLAVPAGTLDLVIAAGADGIERISFGGSDAGPLPVDGVFECEKYEYWPAPPSRLVHARSGEVRETPEGDGVSRHPAIVSFGSVPVGPWRVEVQPTSEAEWQRCRAGSKEGKGRLFWNR